MAKKDKASYIIQSVFHALDVLEHLAKGGREMGVTELATSLGLHKNNIFRLLATLEQRGYVEQNRRTEDYSLGVKLLEVGHAYLKQSPLITKAQPILKELAASTHETASLAVLRNGQVQYPLSAESHRSVKVGSRIAVSFNACENAVGRLLLAQLPESVLAEFLSVTDNQGLQPVDLSSFKASGYIIDRGQLENELVVVAVIVKSFNNTAAAAIELVVPQYRAHAEVLLPKVQEAALKLSASLGASAQAKLSAPLSASVQKEVVSMTDGAGPSQDTEANIDAP